MKKFKSIVALALVGALCAMPLTSYAEEGDGIIAESQTEQTANIQEENEPSTSQDDLEQNDSITSEEKAAAVSEEENADLDNESDVKEDTDGTEEPPVTEEKPPVTEEPPVVERKVPKLVAQAHVQDYGWMNWTEAGKGFVGTTGKSKRMEALKIDVQYDEEVEDESKYSGSVEYQVHVQDYGWMSPQKDGALAGTEGKSKRVEAIRISLTGELKENFDVYYRMHVADFGWLGWTKGGEAAGTEALSRRVEAMELKLVKKGEEGAPATGRSFVKGVNNKDILFTTHIQNVGDTKEASIQNTVGTTGKGRRLEALRLRVKPGDTNLLTGGIEYRTHIQNIGWQGWKANGAMSGTSGQSKRLEAVQIRLTGELAKYYDIYYRTHVQNEGWLGWAKNGQSAGTAKMAYRMEAMQIRLVLKGNAAPGPNSGYYKEGKTGWYYEGGYKFYYKAGVKQLDLDGIIGRQSSYEIKVNRRACTVTVYAKDGNNGYIIPVKRFACSVGKARTATPTGTFYTPAKYRWHTLMGPSYGQYCTRITGAVLFHSVAGRNMTSYNLNARDYNMLGQPASHGCVRLCVRDAKWIYDNCALKTKVTIYDSANPGPLGKPATIKIPAGQTWDPTDPNVRR